MAARSSSLVPERSRASRTTGTMARRCSREANSGTTPPYLPWVIICEATMEERTASPSSTTAAAVSSQEDSMPRMRISLLNLDGAIGRRQLALLGIPDHQPDQIGPRFHVEAGPHRNPLGQPLQRFVLEAQCHYLLNPLRVVSIAIE